MEEEGRKAKVEGKRPCVENQSSASATVASVKRKRPCEDLVENQISASATAASASVKRKRPCEDFLENQISASATAASASASGTNTEVEGAKRLCMQIRMPDYAVMDDMLDEEEDDGYLYNYEGGQLILVGKLPKPKVIFGPPHPHALTFEGMTRRMAETGSTAIRGDDPYGKVPWNPFVAEYMPPSPTASAYGNEA